MTRRSRLLALFVAFPLVLLSTGAWAEKPGPEATPGAKVEPVKPAGAPVVLDGKTLFILREKVLSFTPEDRARRIRRKLDGFLKGPVAVGRPDWEHLHYWNVFMRFGVFAVVAYVVSMQAVIRRLLRREVT